MEGGIPVGIVHRSRFVRDGIAGLLAGNEGVRVLGSFAGGRDALDAGLGNAVLLYDQDTARQDGPAMVRELRGGAAPFVLFNVAEDDRAIIECVRTGAAACLLADASTDDLLDAVVAASRGQTPASPRVVSTLSRYVATVQAPAVAGTRLTEREEQILERVVAGLANKEIAAELSLHPQTVKNYVHLLLQKLNRRSRLDLIRSLRPDAFSSSVPAP